MEQKIIETEWIYIIVLDIQNIIQLISFYIFILSKGFDEFISKVNI